MVMKRRGGRKAKLLLRECWTFLTYIFLHQQWKQCLEFALAKLREICKYLAGACNSNSHARGLHYLTFVWKKPGKSMQWGESSQKMYQKELSIINSLGMRRSLFANWIHYIATKKPQPLCEKLERKGNWRKRNCGQRLIMHSKTCSEKMGGDGGEVRRQWGRGGGRLLYTNLYMSRVK